MYTCYFINKRLQLILKAKIPEQNVILFMILNIERQLFLYLFYMRKNFIAES